MIGFQMLVLTVPQTMKLSEQKGAQAASSSLDQNRRLSNPLYMMMDMRWGNDILKGWGITMLVWRDKRI